MKVYSIEPISFGERIRAKLDRWSTSSKEKIELKHRETLSKLIDTVRSTDFDQLRSKQIESIEFHLGRPLTELIRCSNGEFRLKEVLSLEEKFDQIDKEIERLFHSIDIDDFGFENKRFASVDRRTKQFVFV